MTFTRRTRLVLAGGTMTVAAVFGWQTVANAGDAGRGQGMGQMRNLMESGNRGMAAAHERMMQDPTMAQMYKTMTGTMTSPGS